jgi:Zn-dependent protease
MPSIEMVFSDFIFINLVLMLFNLIPLAPLDGEKILEFFLPANWARTFETIRPYGPMILMGLLFVGPLLGLDFLGTVLGPPLSFLWRALVG